MQAEGSVGRTQEEHNWLRVGRRTGHKYGFYSLPQASRNGTAPVFSRPESLRYSTCNALIGTNTRGRKQACFPGRGPKKFSATKRASRVLEGCQEPESLRKVLGVDSCLGMGSKKEENILSNCSKLFSVFVFRTALELRAGPKGQIM